MANHDAAEIVEQVKEVVHGGTKFIAYDGSTEATIVWGKNSPLELVYLDPNAPAPDKAIMCFMGAMAYVEAIFYPQLLRNPDLYSLYNHIERGATSTGETGKAVRACAQVIIEQFPDRGIGGCVDLDCVEHSLVHRIVGFNDDDATTLEDVEMVLEKAAVRLQEEV